MNILEHEEMKFEIETLTDLDDKHILATTNDNRRVVFVKSPLRALSDTFLMSKSEINNVLSVEKIYS